MWASEFIRYLSSLCSGNWTQTRCCKPPWNPRITLVKLLHILALACQHSVNSERDKQITLLLKTVTVRHAEKWGNIKKKSKTLTRKSSQAAKRSPPSSSPLLILNHCSRGSGVSCPCRRTVGDITQRPRKPSLPCVRHETTITIQMKAQHEMSYRLDLQRWTNIRQ